jgi:hypothetical protein
LNHEDDLKTLQEELCLTPKKWPVIKGTNGVRKARFARPGQGKSGGVRVLYLDFESAEIIFLLTAYPKNTKDNISDEDKHVIRHLVRQLKKFYGGKDEQAKYWPGNN